MFTFTVDPDLESPADFGDIVEYTAALDRAGHGTSSVDEVPYTDSWGEFYSAYSPVFDSSGNVAGIIAADFSVEWFEEQLSAQTRSTVISYAVILVLVLSVAAILSLVTVRPFVRMQAQLLEEKVSAESANRAKSDFLANMSHEIRTPINAVLGMNEMIVRESAQGRALSGADVSAARAAFESIGLYARDVESAGHSLLAIVNDILDFSKIESGHMNVVEAPYQLSSVLNDVSNMIVFKARDKALDFIIDVDESLPENLFGDEIRVRQILTNILNNAVKYTEKGSVTMTVRGDSEVRAPGQVIRLKVAVSDTGIGIKPEDLEKLFAKFERLELDRNSTVEGTGLGLAITRHLLKMMDGEISVESEYGKGSVFTVTVPQKIISAEPVGDFQKRFEENVLEKKPYSESFRAPDARILIVDDTKMNLTVAVGLLKNTEMRIDTADGGARSVEMAAERAYDVILMDQRMPEMDGTEALRRIRAAAGSPNEKTPVVCLTADAVAGARERYLADGFSDYITKPIDVRALEKLLLKYLPAEKIEAVPTEDGETPGAVAPAFDGFAALREAGIDTKTGLMYCRDDESFYRSLLAEYAQEAREKTNALHRFLSKEDWPGYAVAVHALKSTSKMIGASELSRCAAEMEKAANEGNSAAIRRSHAALSDLYASVAAAIRSALPEAETYAESGTGVLEFAPAEDDVMEFLPDDP
ncbi:MAG: response regulator [Oscillospiraceae bacterium]|nr:response regulator [Oscillospiraceae bacterium]